MLTDLKRGLLRILHHQPYARPGDLALATSAPAVPVLIAPGAPASAAIAAYVGVYELAPFFRITVRQRAGQLFVQATGQSEFETEATSPVLFTLKGVPAQVEFAKNSRGEVAQLILHQGGHHQPAAKIE